MIIFISCSVHGQQVDPLTREMALDKYYPENAFIKNKKIKFIIDSSEFIQPYGYRIKAYDQMGRIIGDFSREIEKFNNPYRYERTGDTLYRLKYNTNRELYSYERFVYNSKGQVLSYMECCDYYFEKDQFPVSYEAFYYDEASVLQTKLCYYKREYKGNISERHFIQPTELDLVDVIYYSSKKLKNGNMLITGKHAVGDPEWRETDSSIMNPRKQVTRFNTFSFKGSLGCPMGNNVNRVTEYKYGDSSLTISHYTTDCVAPLSGHDCLRYSEPEKDVETVIYDRQKLMRSRYSSLQGGKQQLSNKYSYLFYP